MRKWYVSTCSYKSFKSPQTIEVVFRIDIGKFEHAQNGYSEYGRLFRLEPETMSTTFPPAVRCFCYCEEL